MLTLPTSASAGETRFLKSPLDGKDGERAGMVERTASCRYPSVPPHQGEWFLLLTGPMAPLYPVKVLYYSFREQKVKSALENSI